MSWSEAGPVISCKSKKQPTDALSTCEAEYTALAATAQGSMYLVQLLNGMDSDCENAPVTVFEDNQGAIALSKNPLSRQPCKRVDIEYHFVRSSLSCGKICIKYCPTADMVADVLTKPVLRVRTDKFVCFNVWGKLKCQMYVMLGLAVSLRASGGVEPCGTVVNVLMLNVPSD